MEEGYFDYAYFSRCNEGCGGGAEAIEDAGYGLAGPEFVEGGVDGGDDEDGRDGEGDDGCDAAQDAGGEVAGVGGHVDAQGPRAGFSDGDHVGNVGCGVPACALADVGDEGEGCETATDGEEACFNEFPDEA